MAAEDAGHRRHHLTHGHVRLRGVDERGHEIDLGVDCVSAESFEGASNFLVVAVATDLVETTPLFELVLVRDAQNREIVVVVALDKVVDGDDGSLTLVSCAMICWVRSAILAAFSDGRARASSSELVWSDWVPPSTPARASMAVRAMLISGCWAVSDTPAVCVWKRSCHERSSFAP